MMAGVVRRDGLRKAVTALRERDDDDLDPLCVKHGDNPTDGVCTCAVPDVPPDPPAAGRDELARVLMDSQASSLGFNAHRLADALLSSGVLVDAADVRARAQEAAWDEGWSAARQVVREKKPGDNPYRDRAVSEREGDDMSTDYERRP